MPLNGKVLDDYDEEDEFDEEEDMDESTPAQYRDSQPKKQTASAKKGKLSYSQSEWVGNLFRCGAEFHSAKSPAGSANQGTGVKVAETTTARAAEKHLDQY
jgi:hypothetical protein